MDDICGKNDMGDNERKWKRNESKMVEQNENWLRVPH